MTLPASVIGPAVGGASCQAWIAWRALQRLALEVEAVDLELDHEVVAVILAVEDLLDELIAVADEIGHAEVERRRRAA